MRKRIIAVCALVVCATAHLLAEGTESLANAATKYELTDTQTFTGDNGLQWTAVGACDTEVGTFKALTISAGVSGNGLSGNLTDEQAAQGIGVVSFQVKGAKAGTGYGLRTFRVTVGDYSKDVTLNVPSMTNSYTFRDTVKQVGATTLRITALETVTGETATFFLYDVQWTSYNGRTDTPTLTIADDADSEFAIDAANDTIYYAEKNISARLASTSAGAVFYYTTDGSQPTEASTAGAMLTLPLDATTTVRAIAVTEADGISDEASWTITTAKGRLITNNCSDVARWEGTQKLHKTARGVSKSGTPYYSFSDSVVTEVYRYPMALSLYANNASNHTLTLSYQTGTYCFENGDSVWQASSEWTVLRTIDKTEFVSNSMKRFQITLPDAAKNEFVRVRLKASGLSIYVDDVNAVVADMPQVALPTFSQSGGQVGAGTQITLACATENAVIYYSVNGGEPQLYSSPIVVNGKTEVRAYAVKDGMARSYTAVALYRLPTIDAPVFDKPTGETLYIGDVINIACANETAVVHYSINGADFVAADGSSATITVDDNIQSVAAYAACDGLLNSDTIIMAYTTAKVLKPEITSGDERAVAPGTPISINCATSGAVLHYKVGDGVWQESTSGLVRDVTIDQPCIIYAYATKDTYLNSDTLYEVFTVTKGTLAPPTADYADGTLLAAGTPVTFATDAGVTVNYRVNGGAWLTAETTVTLTINEATTVELYASMADYSDSDHVTFTYTIAKGKVARPHVTSGDERAVPAGTTININCATENATMHYELNGNGVWETSFGTAGLDVTITTATTIRAYATRTNYLPSDTLLVHYTVATPSAVSGAESAACRVMACDGQIVVLPTEAQTVRIYTLLGQLLCVRHVVGDSRFAVDAGVYVVCVGTQVYKVVVR